MGRPPLSSINVYPVKTARQGFILRWIDPTTGKKKQQQCEAETERAAWREAAELTITLGGTPGVQSASWAAFREAIRERYLPDLSKGSRKIVVNVLKAWEESVGFLLDCSKIGPNEVAIFQKHLKHAAPSTRGKKLRTMKAVLNWGVRNNYVRKCPHIEMPASQRGFIGKGRPKTNEEFKAIRGAISEAVGASYAQSWQTMLDGAWHSGLRLREVLDLTWERLHVKESGAVLIEWGAKDQKSRRIETTATTPEFAKLVLELHKQFPKGPPPDDRPFRPSLSNGPSHHRTVSDVMKTASETTGIPFTFHDLRRSFADRWLRQAEPAEVSRLMRCSIRVIMSYYGEIDAESLALSLMKRATQKPP